MCIYYNTFLHEGVIKYYSKESLPPHNVVKLTVCLVMNVHALFSLPQKVICRLKKNCRHRRRTELPKITGSHLRAVRKPVEQFSLSLGGWLHVVDTFASSKDANRQTQYVRECLGCIRKTRVLPLKSFSSPSQKTIRRFFEVLYLSSSRFNSEL